METEHHPYAMTITMLVLICVIVTLIRPIPVQFTLKQRRIAFTLDYALTPVLAVLVLLISTAMTPSQVARGMLGDDKLQPYAIIILFFSLAYTCIALDVTGLFDYLALRTVQATRGSGTRLFSYFFLFSAALTILTSNDIVILTLTPIIAALASYAKIDPTPALFGQFFAANILSLELFIGNPTNIIVAEAYGLSFLGYSVWMASVGIFAGIICFALLMLVFRHEIPITFRVPVVSTQGVIKDKFGAVYDSIVLGACLVLLSTSSWSHLPIWAITLTSAGLILVRDLARDYQHYRDKRRFTVVLGNDAESPSPPSSPGSHTELISHVITPAGTVPPTSHVPLEATIGSSDHVTDAHHVSESDPDHSFALTTNQVHDSITRVVALRLPWKIVPFVIGVFIIVEGLYDAGWTNLIATGLRHAVMHDNDKVSILIAVLLVSFTSTLACNVLNNQPMTILYTRILLDPAFYGQVSSRAQLGAMLALVLGSNLGANLTLIGALAGIMWSSILSDKGYPMSYFTFAKYGFMITPIVTACASLLLALQIMFFPAINV